jgi:hypothetical protein
MITFTPYPIPVITPLGEAYLVYVESSSMFENDIWTCCLCNGGDIKHFTTEQLKIHKNATFNIYEQKASKETKKASGTNDPKPAT